MLICIDVIYTMNWADIFMVATSVSPPSIDMADHFFSGLGVLIYVYRRVPQSYFAVKLQKRFANH